jgi:hypothetical protein
MRDLWQAVFDIVGKRPRERSAEHLWYAKTRIRTATVQSRNQYPNAFLTSTFFRQSVKAAVCDTPHVPSPLPPVTYYLENVCLLSICD